MKMLRFNSDQWCGIKCMVRVGANYIDLAHTPVAISQTLSLQTNLLKHFCKRKSADFVITENSECEALGMSR